MKLYLKITAFFLVLCLMLSFTACSKNGGESSVPTSSASSSEEGSDTETNPEVSDSQRPYYKPTCVTLSLYDTAENSYGFTWNTEQKPINSVIQICEGEKFDEENCTEISAEVEYETANLPSPALLYVSKAVAKLKPNVTYTYRAYDKGAKIGSNSATFKTSDFGADTFNFVHASDSQVDAGESDVGFLAIGTGKTFGTALEAITRVKPSFLLHTGDMVEYSKYESYWRNMLDYNGKYVRALPFMPISGNHETTYKAGSNEIYKHFNLKIEEQETKKGFYYAFDYGSVKFIMLNSNDQGEKGISEEQYNWLVDTLKNNDKKWTIVAMHHPMYSVGKWGANPELSEYCLKLRKQLTKLFADNKVDLVLQGHDHTYSKTYPIGANGTSDLNYEKQTDNSVEYAVNPKGTVYAVHGAAGDQPRAPFAVDESLFELAAESYQGSWADIKVEKDRITVKVMYDKKGKAAEAYSYGIIKQR